MTTSHDHGEDSGEPAERQADHDRSRLDVASRPTTLRACSASTITSELGRTGLGPSRIGSQGNSRGPGISPRSIRSRRAWVSAADVPPSRLAAVTPWDSRRSAVYSESAGRDGIIRRISSRRTRESGRLMRRVCPWVRCSPLPGVGRTKVAPSPALRRVRRGSFPIHRRL